MVKTTRFDAAEYLDDDETIAAFLDDAFESGDMAVVNRALGDIARAKGMTEISRRSGIAREALYRALSEDGHPQFETIMAVCKALGVRLSVEPDDKKAVAA